MVAHYKEKRRFVRRDIGLTVGLLDGTKFGFSQGVQISEGGMLLVTSWDCRPGDQLELYFFMPSNDFIQAFGEVIYVIPKQKEVAIGIKFIDLPPQYCKAIDEYVSRI